MVIKRMISAFFLFLIVNVPIFAQERNMYTPLLKVKGKIISKQGIIFLITPKGKGYLLTKLPDLEKVFEEVKKFINKDVLVTLSGVDTHITKEIGFINHKTKRAVEEKYRILQVAYINNVEKGGTSFSSNISKPIPYQPPKGLKSETILKRIKGKVTKCNFKNVIPTLELEGKEDFPLLITSNTKVIKTVGDKVIQTSFQNEIKEGTNVEIWYREEGNIRIAYTIFIR